VTLLDKASSLIVIAYGGCNKVEVANEISTCNALWNSWREFVKLFLSDTNYIEYTEGKT
jgi:hypothetical protein